MKDKKLLIVGIDPGTTIGYAAIDIDGRLISLNSSKELDLNLLISQIIGLGRVVLVGTDKGKTPGFVDAFATKLGAKIVTPKADLKVGEKRAMTHNFDFANEHQGDALASALLAYKSTKPLLDKIDFFVQENKMQDIKDEIKELVILKGISIKSAVDVIMKKDEEGLIIEKVINKKKLSEGDYFRLFEKLKMYASEAKLLRDYNNKLRNRLKFFESKQTKSDEEDKSKKIDFKDDRIRFLSNLVKLKDREINGLMSLQKSLNGIFLNINEFYILKKLDTLGVKEYNFKNKVINIKRNDVLLVDDPNIVSYDVVESLKNKVFVIVHKRPISKKNESELPFVYIPAQNIKIEEYKYFGLVEKKAFDFEKSKVDWVKKIVEDYRKEKLILR